ncbi:hypothetical protein SAMN04489806_2050 [Paramicrobacterium humi]|uniref:Uncharacterized protein n=2 Tax=Paramicrobacterium humi TaxID=640635 RepID=A0A1H4N136_9MICO|nr:hypothetical protein SAMN04489806_2050 [Microbacterium humi]
MVPAAALPAGAGNYDCSYATSGTGADRSSICWLNLASFNGGNPTVTDRWTSNKMTLKLSDNYTLSFTMNVNGKSARVVKSSQYWDASFDVQSYKGIASSSVLYQTAQNGMTQLQLDGITLAGPGNGVPAFSMVMADAESTDGAESITFNANAQWTAVGLRPSNCTYPLGSNFTCSGPKPTSGARAAVVRSDSTFVQVQMTGSGLQGVAVGIVLPADPASSVQATATFAGGARALANDSVTVSAARSTSERVSATTGSTSKTATTVVSTSNSTAPATFVVTAANGSTSLSNYALAWTCTRNGASFPPSGSGSASIVVGVAPGDKVLCTVLLTAGTPALSIAQTADRKEVPATNSTVTYTVTAQNVGTAEYAANKLAYLAVDLSSVTDEASFMRATVAVDGGAPVSLTSSFSKLTWSGALPKGSTVVISYTVTYNGTKDEVLTSRAFATNTELAKFPAECVSPSCASVALYHPELTVVKKAGADEGTAKVGTVADPASFIGAQPLNFFYIVENTGSGALSNIVVTDDKGVKITCPQTTLAPKESMTCTGTSDMSAFFPRTS